MNAPVQDKNINANTSNEPSKRGRALLIVTIIFAIVGVAYYVWWNKFSKNFESTEDAYAAGNVVQITPQIAGTVLAIHADDTELVTAGKPLIEFDQSDAKVAVEQAEAQLAQTVREVGVLFANNHSLQASIALRQTDLDRAKADFARRQELRNTGAVSTEEIEHARNAVKTAEAAIVTAQEQLQANHALTDNTSIAQHPNVLRAAAKVREASLLLQRAYVPAPLTGYVAKRSVQVGQRVAPGTPLMSLVALQSLWVDANFKEVQLAHMRIGQDVVLQSDLYGSDVEYHGKVLGVSAGTGSAFALLPAQNASGNWIKVVQRVPVRISLDPKELEAHPLRIGVSMHAKVDVSQQQGAPVAATVRTTPAYQTKVFEKDANEIEQKIAQIIRANLAHARNEKPAAKLSTDETLPNTKKAKSAQQDAGSNAMPQLKLSSELHA